LELMTELPGVINQAKAQPPGKSTPTPKA